MASLLDPCLKCKAGWCFECPNIEDSNCCCGTDSVKLPAQRGGPIKEDEEVTDPKSTGRKRAAVLYPIEEGMPCEWRGLKAACGGKFPIVGCVNGLAKHRHHGPDKNTLNNEKGNVHRVCHTCHNRWHTLNDPIYDDFFGTEDWLPHDPVTIATPQDVIANEIMWQKRKVGIIDDTEH